LFCFFFSAHLYLGIAFAQIGRLFGTGGVWVVAIYGGEIFPTLLRNTSAGIMLVFARLASLAAIFLVFLG